MTRIEDALADAARSLIGVRFRPQGRDPDYGLDCVGLVVAALARSGRPVVVADDYRQRGNDPDRIGEAMHTAGLRRVDEGHSEPGDILLMQAGPLQFHLGIRTVDGMVHADARLRRVVETPGAPRWQVLGVWRCEEAG